MVVGLDTARMVVGLGAFGVHPLWAGSPAALRWMGTTEVPNRGSVEAALCVGRKVNLQAGVVIQRWEGDGVAGPLVGIGHR
ncbi:MAG: hypothetical protein ACI8PZ_000931 [Myxococcota bacterium]|jgi:hypothetical protein